MQLEVNKAASVTAAAAEAAMQAINALALRELTPDEVFVFRCVACDDQIDRDYERFPVATLEKLAPMFVGKPMICDHRWSAESQQARIYRAYVESREDRHTLVTECYMLRSEATRDTIANIEAGILKEVSVGCAMARSVCTICGEDAGTCGHLKGADYNGKTCVYELLDPVDAYELSFVAVPAQPGAGVTKSHEKRWTPAEMAAAKARLRIENERWR